MTRVKICGLRRREDAIAAIEYGADALGFVLEPTSPRCCSLSEMPWLEELPPFIPRIAVHGPAPATLNARFTHVQAVEWSRWHSERPQIHSCRLREGDVAADVIKSVPSCAVLLLDAYHAGGYGGMGSGVDWNLAAEVVQLWPGPVILAGGLTHNNVQEAVETVRPYAVDVSSGIEVEPGVKNHQKMASFIRAVKSL